ncbi:MAG: hypothetical protein RL236_358 [Pseudomonadota bacterium]|jgi:hypothetical protein
MIFFTRYEFKKRWIYRFQNYAEMGLKKRVSFFYDKLRVL